jgi:hypothetical protein
LGTERLRTFGLRGPCPERKRGRTPPRNLPATSDGLTCSFRAPTNRANRFGYNRLLEQPCDRPHTEPRVRWSPDWAATV